MFSDILLFLLGLLVANAGEWSIHKYLLHGLGKNRNSIWAYHWREHHAVCLKNAMIDEGYQHFRFAWNTQTKEFVFMFFAVLSQLPFISVAFWYVVGIYLTIAVYYYVHRKSHLDAEWARRYLPWHYDHHLGSFPDANWCITYPLFDYLMGTRRKG
jgi:hypothetical protein